MAQPAAPAGVRGITLDADGITLSALLALPSQAPCRAMVVALHGAGMSASYFHGPAHPDTSFLDLATSLGFAAVAVDRPGYGLSARQLPQGQGVAEQAATLGAALRSLTARYDTGSGVFLLAHSFGGKPTLRMAADGTVPHLLGLDVSGCGGEYAVPFSARDTHGRRGWQLNWGPLRLYPPGTFQASGAVVASVPPREFADAVRWPEEFADFAGRIRVPVRFTFAEHEAWWQHDQQAVARLRSRLSSAPRVVTDLQPDAGHNISLGWTARAYHLRALGFAEECLRWRESERSPALVSSRSA
ncbi:MULTISPECIES: alpha/beta hydrolase [Streptomyces]|uniref:Thioesterase n=1 Tax=Streptomyces griseorubiginosus TaxID=67304 RepID=A0A117R0C3_9ACTN|nr:MULTISPECIES: alpha/beta hydrolase [Streptomyces]KUM75131.1 thioesterase [Streptomyces griseorubiginosus]KUN64211.1 thioesterase [Streptomyces griseorubiginosus]